MTKTKTEMTTVDMGALPVVGLGGDLGKLEKLANSKSYLQRIQLYSKGKPIETAMIPPGHFGIPVNDTIQDLGDEIDILPLAVRPKAIDCKDRDAIIVSYDDECEAFEVIKEKSEVKNSNCMWGFAFLVFERSTAQYYEFFFGTKTSRNEVGNVAIFLPKTEEQIASLTKKFGRPPQPAGPCTLKVKYIQKGDWGWHAPVTHPCSTPFKGYVCDEAIEQINKFAALKDTELEKVDEPVDGRAH